MPAFPFELVSPGTTTDCAGPLNSTRSGDEGDFQVLTDHAPTVSSVRPGVVAIEDAAGRRHRVFVRGGFAEVNPLGLILLAETAIPFEDLSAAKLDQEIKNAEEDLADAGEDQKRQAQEKLDRLRELRDATKF